MNIKATPFCFRMERAENETVAIFTQKKKINKWNVFCYVVISFYMEYLCFIVFVHVKYSLEFDH